MALPPIDAIRQRARSDRKGGSRLTALLGALVVAAAATLTGCSDWVNKPTALDPAVLNRDALEKRLPRPFKEPPQIVPGPEWLDPLPAEQIAFAGYRTGDGETEYALVLQIDPAADKLVLWPLPQKKSPLLLLNDEDGRRQLLKAVMAWRRGNPPQGYRELPLSRTLAEQRLGPPLPAPRQVFAVAANYLSHLVNDMAVQQAEIEKPLLSRARPRVFLKYPSVPPPGKNATPSPAPLGPYDQITPPETVFIPADLNDAAVEEVPAYFDYEVEIAAVVGRSLAWDEVRTLSDADLQKAVAGYLLAGDNKVRNPQVMRRILTRELPVPAENSYRLGDEELDEAIGLWDPQTCWWWSYAAGSGRHLTLGPFLVAGDGSLPSRAMLAARSYAPAATRGRPIPGDLDPDVFYLRQLAAFSSGQESGRALIWEVPAVIRSILNPDGNALHSVVNPVRLEAGDLILMGTPGGTVITSRPPWQLEMLDVLLFWLSDRQWHNLFFKQGAANYLYPGDRLFFWAEGMGYQKLEVAPPGDAPGDEEVAR